MDHQGRDCCQSGLRVPAPHLVVAASSPGSAEKITRCSFLPFLRSARAGARPAIGSRMALGIARTPATAIFVRPPPTQVRNAGRFWATGGGAVERLVPAGGNGELSRRA